MTTHDVIEKRLKRFNEILVGLGGSQRPYVDTGPILERDFASEAGLGWNGKSTVQIHRRLGYPGSSFRKFSPRWSFRPILPGPGTAGNAPAASPLVRRRRSPRRTSSIPGAASPT